MTIGETTGWIEMRVVDVRRAAAAGDAPTLHVILLEEIDGGRRLPLGVGRFEATALAISMEGADLPSPGPYNFAAGLLTAARCSLREVHVSRLAEGTFYGEAVIEGPEGETRVDARPSDVLNLALVVGVPIRVDPAVVDDAGRSYQAESVKDLKANGAAAIAASARAAYGQAKPMRAPTGERA